MKQFATLFLMLGLFAQAVKSQQAYFQQKADYRISVRLLEDRKAIKGHVSLNYHNQSPDTLNFIWFHIWPNAYTLQNTALAKQVEKDRDLRKIVKTAEKGYADSLLFSAAGKPLVVENHPEHPDIVKVKLQTPLLPGDSVTIETPFFCKLPGYFSRSGVNDGQFVVTQWYPKPAVYDREGWHPMPYLDMGEYYADFGNFDVSIDVPENWVVAASGSLRNPDEYRRLVNAGIQTRDGNGAVLGGTANAGSNRKTLRYTAENVHDFAWFAMPSAMVQYDTCKLASGKIIDVFSYFRPEDSRLWKQTTQYLKDGIRFYSRMFGEYPHPQVTAVQGPRNVNSGGMEYPMITLITVPAKDASDQLETTIVHEVGHNWLQGILGTNERKYPWFDEGINTFFQFRYEAEKGKSSLFGNRLPEEMKNLAPQEFFSMIMQTLASYPFKMPVNTASEAFDSKMDYGATAYIKAAIWLYLLQSRMGQYSFYVGIKEYYETWKFRHPSPADFKKSMEKVAGYPLDDIFALLEKPGTLSSAN